MFRKSSYVFTIVFQYSKRVTLLALGDLARVHKAQRLTRIAVRHLGITQQIIPVSTFKRDIVFVRYQGGFKGLYVRWRDFVGVLYSHVSKEFNVTNAV